MRQVPRELNIRSLGRWLLLLLAFLAVESPCARACQIPVFRYALERWEPVPYEVVVFHRGALSADGKAVDEALRSFGADERGEANYFTREVDLATAVTDDDRKLLESQPNAPLPCIALLLPPNIQNRTVVWSAPLTAANVRRLMDSTARREIVKRIVAGSSAVWVLVEGPRKEDNDAAAATITKQIAEDQKEIELPNGAAEAPAQEGLNLKIAFSLIRIAHGDHAEEMFSKILQSFDPKIAAADVPVAFPVFGRGRIPAAFAGADITSDNIHQTDEFICGPCACEIKEQNPGIDLLFAVDWNKALAGTPFDGPAVPPLTGLPQLAPPPSTPPNSGTSPDQTSIVSNTLNRNIAIAVLAILLFVAALSVLLKVRAKKTKL